MNVCPYCGATTSNPQEEVQHMNTEHPEIVEQRLVKARFRRDADSQWIDVLAGED